MKPGELIVGGIWTFSAVKVAGYTWQAFFGSYEQFPAVGSGNVGDWTQGTNRPQGVAGFLQNTVAAILHPGELFGGLHQAIFGG